MQSLLASQSNEKTLKQREKSNQRRGKSEEGKQPLVD